MQLLVLSLLNSVDDTGTCVRLPPNNNPVTSVTSTDIRCNVGVGVESYSFPLHTSLNVRSSPGQDTLNSNCGKGTFTAPSSLAPGACLVGPEVITRNAVQTVGGAQFYMSGFEVHVAGSGTVNPTGVLFPGAYKATDPGILINIYSTITSYTISGPSAVFTG